MGAFEDLFDQVYRDFTMDGVEASGRWSPEKDDIRPIGRALDTAFAAAVSSMVLYGTLAMAQAAAAVTPGTQARVFNDGANNGVYVNKTGAVGGYAFDNDYYNKLAGIVQPLLDATTQAKADAIASALQIAGLMGKAADTPNLFTRAELKFEDTTRIVVGADFPTVQYAVRSATGRRSAKVTNTSGAAKRFTFRRLRSELPTDATKFSASMVVEGLAGDGNAYSVTVQQNNAAGNAIAGTSSTKAIAASAGAQLVTFDALTIDANCAAIVLFFSSNGTTTQAFIRDQMICAGSLSGFYPADKDVNLWPDPTLEGNRAITLGNTGTVVNGDRVLTLTGAGNTVLNRYAVDAAAEFAPGAFLSLRVSRTSDVGGDNTASVAILFMNGAAEISRVEDKAVAAANVEERITIGAQVPDTCTSVHVWLSKRVAASTVSFRRPVLLSNISIARDPFNWFPAIVQDRRVFVAKTGSDAASGGVGAPMQSLAAAMQSIKVTAGGGEIILDEGEYNVIAPIVPTTTRVPGPMTIRAQESKRVVITRTAKLPSITKTAGATKVYQCPLASAPTKYVWQHDVADTRTAIPLADRVALQKGRANRLPHVRIGQVTGAGSVAAGIAAIDADAVNPLWYYDATNHILYFSILGGGDGTAADIRIPHNSSPVIGGGASRLTLVKLELYYGSSGLSIAQDGTSPYSGLTELFDVIAGATVDNAIKYDDCQMLRSYMCETFGSENDGYNAHTNLASTGKMSVSETFDLWSHDNDGDGQSEHGNSRVAIRGGLYEYNGKAGIVPANGCKATAFGSYARHNGLLIPAGGGGFSYTNAIDADSGVGGQFDVFNCVSEANPYGFMCGPSGGTGGGTTDASHAIRAYQCISRNNTVAGYYANTGTLRAFGCTDTGSAAAKLTAGGGSIIVENGALLT